MTELGFAFLWCAIQITLVTVAGAALYLLLRRRGPVVAKFILQTTFCVVLMLSISFLSPWPNWSGSRFDQETETTGKIATESDSVAGTASSSEIAANSPEIVKSQSAPQASRVSRWQSAAWFLQTLQERQAPATKPAAESTVSSSPVPTWIPWTGAILLAGILAGFLRLLWGFQTLRRYRRSSLPIESADLAELALVIQAELNCRSTLQLRETERLRTAATAGWRTPVILLSTGWREWTAEEQRAILAHEIAHVRRHDFLGSCLAQFTLLLHFYHPLLHWLSQRLQLEQEIAADATAASVNGGRKVYMKTLARMLLRTSDPKLPAPARPFLSTRHTFLRRIHMLKQDRPLNLTLSMKARAVILCSLVSAGVLAAGIRGVNAQEQPANEDLPAVNLQLDDGTAETAVQSDSLAYVGKHSVGVVSLKLSETLNDPEFRPVAKLLMQDDQFQKSLGVAPNRVSRIIYVMSQTTRGGPTSGGTIVHLTGKLAEGEGLAVFEENQKPERKQFQGMTYYQVNRYPNSYIAFPNETTILLTETEEALQHLIINGKTGATEASWAARWRSVENSAVAGLVRMSSVRRYLEAAANEGNGPGASIQLAVTKPLWMNPETYTFSLSHDKGFSLAITAQCSSAEKATELSQTAGAMLILTKNMLPQLEATSANAPPRERVMMNQMITLMKTGLTNAEVKQTEAQVVATTSFAQEGTRQIIGTFLGGTLQARAAARRTQSMNNLKQIALGFHNYHDVYGKFPTSVMLGPDGKTPHSWRVAILPYLDQQPLYDMYRLNEPWDSEHNKKVLAMIPQVYRSPAETRSEPYTSYLGFVGPNQQRPSPVMTTPNGTKIQEIHDGTSNTILVVESKAKVPWTKPEDLPFDPKKDVPKLGGFFDGVFLAALCDGSVRAIAETIDQNVLKALIQMNDGQVIPEFE